MNKKMIQEVLKLTEECISRYWQLDIDFILSYCHEDVMWTGALQSEFMEGKEAMTKDFKALIKELKHCHMDRQEFLVVQNTGNVCTIAGRYLVTTDETEEYFLQAQQRCTCVWELIDGKLQIRHLHVSNPIGEMKVAEGELFVNQMGRMAKKYLLRHLRDLQDKDRLAVADMNDHIHFLSYQDILYVTACGRNCMIATRSLGKLEIHMSITEVLKAAGERLLSIHRSYAVNRQHISSVRRYEAVMANGDVIPLPVKRYKELREILLQDHERV